MTERLTTSAFNQNQPAQSLHEQGLKSEIVGDYDQADSLFNQAIDLLEPSASTIDNQLQLAKIYRDLGFNLVRHSISDLDLSELNKGKKNIEESGAKTFIHIFKIDSPRLNTYQQRELLAEHGATINLLARTATLETVIFKQSDKFNRPEKIYTTAHRFLKKGNNGYYRTSNTLTAARQERINKHHLQAFKWLGRAAISVSWTALFDSKNLGPSVKTLAHRLPDLTNQKKAIDSLSSKP